MGTDHVADVVFMYCFSPCYYCCCVVVIFALLLFSLMGLRAVSPLAAVYSSMSHRVFLSSARVLCVSVWWTGATAGACMFGRARTCIVVARGVLCLLFALLALCCGRFLGRWSSVLGDVISVERNDWQVG